MNKLNRNPNEHLEATNREEVFFNLEHPYEAKISRTEGEIALSTIAQTSDREHVWAFDEENQMWHYHPSDSIEKIYPKEERVQYETNIPRDLLLPPSKSSISYHTHPDVIILKMLEIKPTLNKEAAQISSQMPSGEDLTAIIKLTHNGYKKMRIVTSLGITTLTFNPEIAGAQKQFAGITIPAETIAEALEGGFNTAIDRVIDELNNHYDGFFTFKFRAHGTDPDPYA